MEETENNLSNKKIAIVVEELTQLGGAEKVLDAVMEIFPKAPIFTLVYDREKTNHRYDKFEIHPSFIQKLPFAIKHYKWYLTLMPHAVESFDLKKFDIIFSITSALVKGVKTQENQLHICYCNTPTRYLWTDSREYVKHAPIPFFIRPLMPWVINRLRKWDLLAAKRPDYFIANSKNVQERIQKYYHRDSYVIYPNVETKKFSRLTLPKKDYFLLVSRLEPYKKVDLVIEAFNKLTHKLLIVGGGTWMEKYRTRAKANIEFVGRVSDKELPALYRQAEGFIFPQEEDFGITAVEAQAAGTPVIAYRAGGALETVIPGKTGEFFYPQTPEALGKTITQFTEEKYKPNDLINQAQKFDQDIFKAKIVEYIISKANQQLTPKE